MYATFRNVIKNNRIFKKIYNNAFNNALINSQTINNLQRITKKNDS